MGRAVVTGAAGPLGSAVTHALRQRGDRVDAFDDVRTPGATVADIGRPGDWQHALRGADLVVAAGRPSAQLDVLLDTAARERVGRLVHLSGVAVHGSDFPDQVDEGAPLRPVGAPHADAVAAAERHALATAARTGLPMTVVRIGDVYGPRADAWTMRPVAALRAGSFTLLDRGRGVLSPVYVDDVVDAVLALAGTPAAVGEVVHVTGGVGVSARDFFGHYVRMLGTRPPRSLPLRLARALSGPGSPWRSQVTPDRVHALTRAGTYSIAKARRLTGWHPRVPLEDGMSRTELWLRERGLLGVPEPARRG